MDNKNRYLSVTYQLYTLIDGEKSLEEQTDNDHPFQFISGFGISLDAFERQVVELATGSEFDFTLSPAEAFGDYDPDGVRKLERDVFNINGRFDTEHIRVGNIIPMMDEEGNHVMARILKIEDDGVTLDLNHPLAGKTLNFTGRIVENREATEQELTAIIKQLTGDQSCSGCQGCGGQGEGNCSGNNSGCGGCN